MSTNTDWEQHYQDGETPWDKGAPSPGLVDWLTQNEVAGRVIVPGCGLGHDVRALAASSGRPQVTGLDVAPSAVTKAQSFPQVGAENFERGDWFDLKAEQRDNFDWVWEHTCFCAIDPSLREAYVDAAFSALKPGGSLLGVFYLDPYDDEHQPGEGPPHGVEEKELVDYFIADGRFSLQQRWLPQSAYPGREGLELMLLLRRNG